MFLIRHRCTLLLVAFLFLVHCGGSVGEAELDENAFSEINTPLEENPKGEAPSEKGVEGSKKGGFEQHESSEDSLARWKASLLEELRSISADSIWKDVDPVGFYESIRETEDHVYGQRLHLWKKGTRPYGELFVWEGAPEPLHRAAIVRGHIEEDSIYCELTSPEENSKKVYILRGKLKGDSIDGEIHYDSLYGEIRYFDPELDPEGAYLQDELGLERRTKGGKPFSLVKGY